VVKFGIAAEIVSLVWGNPANFNGFRVLAALLHGTQVVSVSQNFAALNRGRHLCSAGRPSGWALAHILVTVYFAHITYRSVVVSITVSHCPVLQIPVTPSVAWSKCSHVVLVIIGCAVKDPAVTHSRSTLHCDIERSLQVTLAFG